MDAPDGPAPPATRGATDAAPACLHSAPWVLPIVAPPLREGAVALDARGTVLAVGARAELRARWPAVPEQRHPGAVMPALVNAHLHLELSALAVPAPDAPNVPAPGFLPWAGALVRANAALDEASRARAIPAALAQLRAAGVGAVGDVGNTLAALPALAAEALPGVFFHELLGARERATGDALADAERERAAHVARAGWPAALRYTPAPHALYSADPPLLRRTFAAAAARGVPTTIHVAEDADEVALLREGRGPWVETLRRLGFDPALRSPGCGPLRYLERLGAFAGAPPLLVHMVRADREDLALAAAHAAPIVLCPRSNLHIGGRLPDVPDMLAAGCKLALGTDSLASSPGLSPWEELSTLARAFPAVPGATWLHAATRGGAAALALPLGALRPGWRPGVIAVELDRVAAAPENGLARSGTPAITWLAAAACAPPTPT